MTTPFTFEEVTQAAEKILQRDRFDTDLVYSDTDDSDSEDSDISEDSDSDTDSSSEEEYIKRAKTSERAKHKKILPSKTTMHKTRFEDSSDEEETPIAKTRKAVHKQRSTKQNPQEEVENLIQQLGRMRIGDVNYSTLYYKAITLDPAVKEIIEMPDIPPRNNNTGNMNNNLSNVPRATNSMYNNGSPNTTPMYPPHTPYPPRVGCYGCRERGHGLAGCPKIEDMLTKGLLRKSEETGRIELPEGTPLRRWGDDTLVQAYENMMRSVTTHFVRWEEEETDSVFKDEEREIYWTIENINAKESKDEIEAHPAYRTEKEGTHKRTEIFDGVYPSKGRDTRDEMKKGQRQRYKLRGD
ncbi:hypothetical protein EV702DRAFT_1046303 [Suillus placidus]|uniref:Uncharacterized protein n=1 Tax=Suillus placidus TaxID=48579 RepID=A0A9P7D1W9_9AGAM|nr:hypothetical protein EV702DRAFT_1046303 [Suillus placidus]